jgi:putative spermidine/putrescine transport system substrate-binding protein
VKRHRFGIIALAVLVIALAVPAAGVSKGSGLPTSVGAGEGKLTLVAWEGYTQPQWVKPFEKATGCQVSTKYAGSSNDMFNLMTSGGGGQYDMVSASGDASLRLIYAKAVQEINVGLIPSYRDFFKAFQSPPNNTVGGKHFGVSVQFGPNVLLYNTKKFKTKPTSWAAVYDSKNKGQITIPDNPIQIADAALYLSKTKPALGIKDPYELTKVQLAAAVALLKQQRPLVKKYWGLASDQIDLFKNGGSTIGASWPYQYSQLVAAKVPVATVIPKRHGLAGHVDALIEGEASELRLQVDAIHHHAEGTGPAGDLLR